MKKCKTTVNKFIWILIAVILIWSIWELYSSKNCLSLSKYNIESDKITAPIRILQISDLHNNAFGKNNQKLLDMASEQSPDIILLTGDLINADEENIDIAVSLIEKLGDIAPVYISLGNHEIAYQRNYGEDIEAVFSKADACVLNKDYLDLEINGQSIRIGGMYGYGLHEKFTNKGPVDDEECDFLKEFQDTECYTVLMSHMPVCWLINDGLEEWNVNCVFSGHAHGGEVILPVIGGIYAPDFGWFREICRGLIIRKTKIKY